MNAAAQSDAPGNPAMRTCVGCRKPTPKHELVRLAVVPAPPYLVLDPKNQLGGRGVWVMPDRDCIVKAATKGGFARAMAKPLRDAKDAGTPMAAPRIDPNELLQGIELQLRRRLKGLAHGARRGRKVGLGTEAVRQGLARRATRLLWVAEDAAGASNDFRASAERLGEHCVVFGNKAEIGELFGRTALGVVSVEDEGLADTIKQVISQIAGLQSSQGPS